MPLASLLGGFADRAVVGFVLREVIKKLVVYGGLGFLAWQMVKNK